MKNYNLSKINNKKQRQKWMKENPKYIYSFTPFLKFLMLVIYEKKEIKGCLPNQKYFNLGFTYINRCMNLLVEVGFIEKLGLTRNMKWIITNKGIEYCESLLKFIK